MSLPQNIEDASHKVYTPFTLKIYNFIVQNSNRWAWKCPTEKQLNFFNENISACHLDVGVGSGFFIDNCNFPASKVKLALLDSNQNCLNYCALKLKRYYPQLYKHDIFQPITVIQDKFSSISLNYVLHCLPGNFSNKEVVINNLKKLMTDDGTIFGSTILGKGIIPNYIAKKLLKLYNEKQIFSNLNDDIDSLTQMLNKHFVYVEIFQIGLIAFFKASTLKLGEYTLRD